MFIAKLAYRLYLIGVYLGLWHGQQLLQHHAAVHLGHPVYGVALRQGRRFSMEDRVIISTSNLPGGRFCSSANYTYAAVYDGHDGSAACDMLVQQLHPAVYAAAAAAWQSNCTLHQPRLQGTVIHAAQQLNNAFLQEAKLHAAASQRQQQKQRAGGDSKDTQAVDNGDTRSTTSSGSKDGDGFTPRSATAASAAGANAAGGTAFSAPGSTSGSTATAWDGDDGSTAVFAVMVRQQLLIGNVGNSRAILCTSRHGDAPSNKPSNSSTGKHLVCSSRSGQGRARSSTSSETCKVKGASSSSGSTSRSSSSSCKELAEHKPPQLVQGSNTDVLPFTVSSSTRNLADLLRQQKQRQQQGTATSSSSSSGTMQQPAEIAPSFQPPLQPLHALSLTSDHTPARNDETARIRQAGGDVFVSHAAPTGKLRVRGELEITRSFGDLGFQDQGVVPTPEFTTHTLQPGDAFLVLASDGLFESVTTEEVCQHAWAVWSGSSSIRAALPPPPALALPGEVSSGSGIGKGLGAAAADDAAALPTGCCDCTPQQQLMAAVGADAFDATAVLRRERRQKRKRQWEEQQQEWQLQVGDEIHAADSMQLGRLQQQSAQEKILMSEDQQAMMMCRMGAAGDDVWEGHCTWEDNPEFQDEVAAGSATLEGGATAGVADGEASSASAGTCRTTGADFDDPDADYVDDYAVPDISYSYCPNPLGITAPYTLAQAIALRLVNEAYNRMSMDNIAVAVLDVREAAEAAEGSHKQQQQQRHQGRSTAGESAATGSHQGMSAPGSGSSSTSTTQIAKVAASDNCSSGSSSSDSDDVNPAGEESVRLASAEDYHDTADDLRLPHCHVHSIVTPADPTAAVTVAAVASVEEGVQPGSPGSSTGPSEHAAPCEQGSPCAAAAAAAAAGMTHPPTVTSSSSDSRSTALQRLSQEPLRQSLGSQESGQTAFIQPGKGTALLCGPHSDDDATDPASPYADSAGWQTTHSTQTDGNRHHQRQQQQHFGEDSASGAGASSMNAAGRQGAGHQYVLLQRVADAAMPLPSHVHLHPMLGVDQVELEDGAEGFKGLLDEDCQQQQPSHALSLARHMQPASLLLLLRLPNRAASSVGREQLCQMLSPGDAQPAQQQHQVVQQQQQAAQQQALAQSPLPAHAQQLLQPSSKELEVVYNQGFMSACIAGAAADAGNALVKGGDGLAAVVAALAAVPLQGVPALNGDTAAAAAVDASDGHVHGSSQLDEQQLGVGSDLDSSGAAAAAAVNDDEKDGLIEPSWGRVSSSSRSSNSPTSAGGHRHPGSAGISHQQSTAVTDAKQQQQQQQEGRGVTVPESVQPRNHSGVALIRAGLLMLLQRPRRTLLAWSKPIQQSLLLQPAHAPGQHAPGQQQSGQREQGSAPGTQLLLKDVLLSSLHGDLEGSTAADLAGSTLGRQYKLGRQYGRGHFGEVWSAVRSRTGGTDGSTDMSEGSTGSGTAGSTAGSTASTEEAELLVLKRVSGTRGSAVRRSALREVHFGQLLTQERLRLQRQDQQQQQQQPGTRATLSAAVNISMLLSGHEHLVRYVEGFTTSSGDVWLVFKNEGQSLHSLMYEPVHGVPTSDVISKPSPEDQIADSSSSSNAGQSSHSSNTGSSSSSSSEASAGAAGLSVVGTSRWWKAARKSPASHDFVAALMQQLLQGLAAVQAANISHRDVKPENLLVKPRSAVAPRTTAASVAADNTHNNSYNSGYNSSGRFGTVGGPSNGGTMLQPDPLSLHVRLIDFGSAVDAHSVRRGLYGRSEATVAGGGAAAAAAAGPGLDELTLEYAAPEVIFSSRYHSPLTVPSQLHAYDMWSAGVVMLELVLGTPAVFAPSPPTRAALDKQLRLRGRPAGERQLLYLLRGLMELCIYPPRVKLRSTTKAPAGTPAAAEAAGAAAASAELAASAKASTHRRDRQHTAFSTSSGSSDVPIPWSCSDESLLLLISSRDPMGVGLEGGVALRLLQRLLAWDPAQRPTARQALQHAYFTTARQKLAETVSGTGSSGGSGGGGGGSQRGKGQDALGDNVRKSRTVGDDNYEQQQQQQQSVEAVRALLQRQHAVLQSCSSVAVGEPGWC